MERMNESGQWIILMGILVSIAIFFLAFIINQSALVGQTTAEGVLEFPKNEIQDTRSEIFRWSISIHYTQDSAKRLEEQRAIQDLATLAKYRRNAEIWFDIGTNQTERQSVSGKYYYPIRIHYNNGVTEYNEDLTYAISNQ